MNSLVEPKTMAAGGADCVLALAQNRNHSEGIFDEAIALNPAWVDQDDGVVEVNFT